MACSLISFCVWKAILCSARHEHRGWAGEREREIGGRARERVRETGTRVPLFMSRRISARSPGVHHTGPKELDLPPPPLSPRKTGCARRGVHGRLDGRTNNIVTFGATGLSGRNAQGGCKRLAWRSTGTFRGSRVEEGVEERVCGGCAASRCVPSSLTFAVCNGRGRGGVEWLPLVKTPAGAGAGGLTVRTQAVGSA